MAKFRLTVLFLISLCIACNRGRISNSLDEKILACGNDAKASTDYIFVSGPSGARSDPGLFVIDGALHVTSKGCVERPKDGQYFVSSSDKKQGRCIDSKAPRSLSLLELQNSNIPAICSGIIHSDNSGFALEIQNYQASADPKFLTLDVKLFLNANQAQEISWATREFASLNSFKFPVGAKLSAGEYKLGVVIKDKLRDVTTNSDCTLRIDDSELKISPADRILEKRRFNGQEVLIVQPGYTLDFYVHTGFRDVKIDFCLERIKYSDISKDLFETSKACRVSENFLDSRSESLHDGFWVLKYKASRGVVETDWITAIFLVEKVCVGEVHSMVSIASQGCTSIKGNIIVEDLDETNQVALDQIGKVVGNIAIKKSLATKLSLFPNLSDLVGDLKVEENSSLVSLSGFDNLTFVLGRIDFSNNSAMVTLSGFRSLQSVAQSLDFSNNENLINIPNFLELTSVGSSLNLEFIKIASLSNFKSLKTVGRLRLLGLSNLKDLFGLESLSRAETIELRHNPQLRNFDGLSGLRLVSTIELGDMQIFESFKGLYSIETVASLDIRDCHKVKDLTVNGRSVEITENLDLVGPMELVDLSQLTFASTLRHLIIDNSNLQSLSGFESVNEIQSFQLGNMTRMVTLKGAIGLIKVGTLILDSMDIANLNEFVDGHAKALTADQIRL